MGYSECGDNGEVLPKYGAETRQEMDNRLKQDLETV